METDQEIAVYNQLVCKSPSKFLFVTQKFCNYVNNTLLIRKPKLLSTNNHFMCKSNHLFGLSALSEVYLSSKYKISKMMLSTFQIANQYWNIKMKVHNSKFELGFVVWLFCWIFATNFYLLVVATEFQTWLLTRPLEIPASSHQQIIKYESKYVNSSLIRCFLQVWSLFCK